MKTLLIIFFLSLTMANSDQDDERLTGFLNKLEQLYQRQKSEVDKWPMPAYAPQSQDNMPQAALSVRDEDTGLEYSRQNNVILDRDLEFKLDLTSGMVSDLTTGKKWSYSELQKMRKGTQKTSL